MSKFIFFNFLIVFLIISSCQEAQEGENLTYTEYRQDVSRFYAHAGGKIDGHKYTNCQEALDFNYQKGFRFFELDFIATSDSQLVASHDWEKWKKQTNYSGEIPVSKAVFLESKIFSKYTPLSLTEINAWFQAHEDAVLVTDKLTDASLIVNQFIDKERLMMELFSLEAIQEAQSLGFYNILASEKVIQSFGKKRIEKLVEHQIKYVTFSISYMENNRSFLKELEEHNIKAIVYNLTDEKNENYLIENEMNNIYGFYADNWDF